MRSSAFVWISQAPEVHSRGDQRVAKTHFAGEPKTFHYFTDAAFSPDCKHAYVVFVVRYANWGYWQPLVLLDDAPLETSSSWAKGAVAWPVAQRAGDGLSIGRQPVISKMGLGQSAAHCEAESEKVRLSLRRLEDVFTATVFFEVVFVDDCARGNTDRIS